MSVIYRTNYRVQYLKHIGLYLTFTTFLQLVLDFVYVYVYTVSKDKDKKTEQENEFRISETRN